MPLDVFCIDVDGVMTDGTFFYSSKGKLLKRFGPEDGDALEVLRRYIEIRFVTADHRGLAISRARIERDLAFPLDLVPGRSRLDWLAEKYSLDRVAYMGDSFTDCGTLAAVRLGISPSNAHHFAQESSDFCTKSAGGHGAVAEACFFVAEFLGLEPPEFTFIRK